MKRSVFMAKLCYEDQAKAITSIIDEEVAYLKSLPKEEAEVEANKSLLKVGIIDEEGNYTAPYIALGKRYV